MEASGRARALLEAIETDLPELAQPEQSGLELSLIAEYLYAHARLALLAGQDEAARALLSRALEALAGLGPAEQQSMSDRFRIVEAQYLWWQDSGSLPEASPVLALRPAGELRYCKESMLNAQLALMQGNRDRAAEEVRYLVSKGYRGADLARLCSEHSLCDL